MSGVVKSMDATLKSMNLEKVKKLHIYEHVNRENINQNFFIQTF